MPIRRRNPRNKVILAGVKGVIIGVVGVLIFGLILNLSNEKKEKKEETSPPIEQEEKENVVEVNADVVLPFKARQFGMFTTKESAISFISEQPSLEKASIVRVEDQFYVWKELFVNEVSTNEGETLPTFLKPLFISTKGCTDPRVKNVMNILQQEKISKNYFDSLEKKEDYPDDFMTIVGAISAFSDAASVMRLHIFTHYLEQNECVKLNF